MDFDNFDVNLKSTENPGTFLNTNLSSFGIINDDNGTMTTDGSEGIQLIDEYGYMDVNSTYQDFNVQSTPSTTCVVMGKPFSYLIYLSNT